MDHLCFKPETLSGGIEKVTLTLEERNDDFCLRKVSSRWLVLWLWGSRGDQTERRKMRMRT